MQEINQHKFIVKPEKKGAQLLPIIVLWAAVFILGFVFWGTFGNGFTQFKNFYILPWVLLTALVIATPIVYLIYKKQFNIYHPVVFAALTYFIPAFVVGGFLLSAGASEPYFIAYVKDPEYNFPYTYFIAMLGYAGLSVGFFSANRKFFRQKSQEYSAGFEMETGKFIFSRFSASLLRDFYDHICLCGRRFGLSIGANYRNL